MEPFKNLYSLENARLIAKALQRAYPAFPVKRFLAGLGSELEARELKARMALLAERIQLALPNDPPTLFPILCHALARDDDDTVGLKSFAVWPLTEIVAQRGLDHFPASMEALREMTIRFTAEFAIRPFLRNDLPRTLAQLKAWTAHPNEHVRRLTSEGSRPLLPWGERLPAIQKNPSLTLPILEALMDDPSEYVRRSVANHLNDHAKAHPDFVIDTLSRWLKSTPQGKAPASRVRLARHASRTLLKDGHPGALRLHGYAAAKDLELLSLKITPRQITLGGALQYQLRLQNHSRRPAQVLFDYAIHHLKANGRHSPKVFKGRTRTLAPGEIWEVSGSHPLRPVTTRRYHPGQHYFEPRINGSTSPRQGFTLLIPPA